MDILSAYLQRVSSGSLQIGTTVYQVHLYQVHLPVAVASRESCETFLKAQDKLTCCQNVSKTEILY